MAKFLLLFICVLSFITDLKAQQPVYNRRFVYDQKVFDFGTIQEKAGEVRHTFIFTNKGTKPVIISDVQAWCGCTSADFTKQPVMPGKQAKVTVAFNPYNRPGRFSKEVVIALNDGKEYTRIWIRGNVIGYLHPVTEDHPYAYGEGLYMNLSVLPFPDLQPGQEHSFRLRIANNTNKTMVIAFHRQPENTVLKMPRGITLQPKQRTVVKVSYTACKRYRYNRRMTLQPIVNGKKVKSLKITWLATHP